MDTGRYRHWPRKRHRLWRFQCCQEGQGGRKSHCCRYEQSVFPNIRISKEYEKQPELSQDMLAKARKLAEPSGISNTEFVESRIIHIVLGSGIADCVISNCVINLVPSLEKQQVFNEIFRLLNQAVESPCLIPSEGRHFQKLSRIVLVCALAEFRVRAGRRSMSNTCLWLDIRVRTLLITKPGHAH